MAPDVPAVVGVHEIAQLAGVSTSTVVSWRKRHEDFPQPLAVLRMGSVWATASVLPYLRRHGYDISGV